MRLHVLLQNGMLTILFATLLGFTPELLNAVQGQATAQVQKVGLNELQQNFYRAELEVEISIDFENLTLNDALNYIAEKTGLKLTYRGDKIVEKEVSLQSDNISVNDALNNILEGTNLEYLISGSGYLLIREIIPEIEEIGIQEIISGQVIDSESGVTLPGVNIVLEGTTIGTSTDENGNFQLEVPDLQGSLIISYIGYATKEVPINNNTQLRIELSSSILGIDELVVTALGIDRDPRSITYSTQSVSSDDLNLVRTENFMDALAGKSAGLMVTAGAGGPGSEPRIILRGHNSITGSNQPLYVVDGIPMSSSITDFNSEDIESVQVLKGASAAALYGSQAANGVILIETKSGTRGSAPIINISSTTTISRPWVLPELQTSYGQGSGGVLDTSVNDSWGPQISDGSDRHLMDFFRTGISSMNTISISHGNELGRIYGSYGYTDDRGIVPENELTRNNVTLRFNSTEFMDNRLLLEAAANYNSQTVYNQPGFGHGPIFALYTFPVGDDFSKYSGDNFEVWDPVRLVNVQNWPYIRNETRPHQNPYWNQNRMQNETDRNRLLLSLSADYNILDWLSIEGRISHDVINTDYEQRYHASTQSTVSGINGTYWRSSSSGSQTYYDLILNHGTRYISENVTFTGILGFSHTENTNSSISFNGGIRPDMLFPNYFSLSNLAGNFNRSESLTKSQLQAAFTNITFGLFDRVWLDLTGRNEWSTTVEDSYFYPSVGLSYVFSENPNSDISFARVRASYSEVGSDLAFGIANLNPPLSLSSSGDVNPVGTLPFFSGADTTSLNPERTNSLEIGGDVRFFEDRLSIELTYYDATTHDQVFSIAAPAGSGAQNFWINGGSIRNQGVEAVISYGSMINNIGWLTTLNFSYNRNQIRELSDLLDAERYVLSGGREVRLYLYRPDEDGNYFSFGDLYGNDLQRDSNGNLITNDNGIPIRNDDDNTLLGNANPDFLASISNNIDYRNFRFSFLIDGRFGGGVASHTERWLDYKGLSKRTGEARDNGGVMVNGNMVDAQDYYYMLSNTGDGTIQDAYFYDATNIRLRELSIGYSFPTFQNINLRLSMVGRNLFFFYKNAPFDPEITRSTASSSLGLNDFEMPTLRSFGLNVNIEI
jgi:TonB-linked SusC/RagA family outer membrane protein